MKLTGLHLLLTYSCNFECDHCFVWGSPWQSGVFTLQQIRFVLQAAQETGTVEWIYFEGGEPFLYYPILLEAVKLAGEMGFKVGIVTNAYWATSDEDALHWLSSLRRAYPGSDRQQRPVPLQRKTEPAGPASNAPPHNSLRFPAG